MCVSTDLADFTGTSVYVGRRDHPVHGHIEVVGYQNTPVNLASGPNAMLLHLPAARPMNPRHFISVNRHPDLLDRIVRAASELPGGVDWMGGTGARAPSARVHVFEHDIYTVLLASDPTRVPAALKRVPEHKRPHLNPELMEFYADLYPGYTIAVCCFDNADARRAAPLFLWYEPLDPSVLVAPALDCHTGGPPDLDVPVRTDHWVVWGLDSVPENWGTRVRYPGGMRRNLRPFLPDRVLGDHYTSELPNGDFAITCDDLRTGDVHFTVKRRRPSGDLQPIRRRGAG